MNLGSTHHLYCQTTVLYCVTQGSKNRRAADTPFLRFAGRRGVGNLAQTGNTGSHLACWGLTIPTVAFRQDYSLLSDLYRASLYISSLIDIKLLERNFPTSLMLCS